MIESLNSLQRIGRHSRITTEFRETHEKKDGNSISTRRPANIYEQRTEDRLAGGDADAALATLITVSGIYWGIKHKGVNMPLPEALEDLKELPTTLGEYNTMLDATEHSDLARELLGEELSNEVISLRREQLHEMLAANPHPDTPVKEFKYEGPVRTKVLGTVMGSNLN